MLVYGAIFAVMTALIFTLMGGFAARLAGWLQQRPRAIRGVNIGAGLSILTLKQRSVP